MTRERLRRAGKAVVGDRYGLALLLAALVFFGLYWRVEVFINDNYTVANALVALADGGFHIERATYGPGLDTPGMHQVGETVVGRNYGHVIVTLPFVWALEGLTHVFDLRLLVVAGWSLTVLALAVVVGDLLERPRAGRLGGSAIALVAFLGNAALATPLDLRWVDFIALQVTTMLAAGLTGVVLYRLLTRMHDRRTGLAAGVATVFATPVAFWASLPKRHAVTSLLVVCALYALYRAREEADPRFRAGAYACAGLTAWVHAPEALVLLLAVALVDLPTGSRDPRDLAVVAGGFALSLVPFLLTNYALSGNPVKPARLLPNYGTAAAEAFGNDGTAGGSSGGGGDSGGTSGATGGSPEAGGSEWWDVGVRLRLGRLLRYPMLFADLFVDGIRTGVRAPDRLTEIFARSGYIERATGRDAGESINLSVVESAPILAAVVAFPVRWARSRPSGFTPARTVDATLVVYAVLLTVIYLPRLPIHAQVTVRYLLPLFPLGIYAVARLPATRRVLHAELPTLGWSYGLGVLLGTQLLLAVVVGGDLALGERVQLHGQLGVLLALLLGGWAIAATRTERYDRAGAALLGLTAAAGTAFTLLSGWLYFAYVGQYALPVVARLVALF